MVETQISDADAREMVRTLVKRTAYGWTTEHLAGRLALPIGLTARVLVDLARRGLVVSLDGEWYSAETLLAHR